MKVIRIICPKCDKEEKHIEEVSNMQKYTEELVYRKCSECKESVTPEDKLLSAIFGEEDEL